MLCDAARHYHACPPYPTPRKEYAPTTMLSQKCFPPNECPQRTPLSLSDQQSQNRKHPSHNNAHAPPHPLRRSGRERKRRRSHRRRPSRRSQQRLRRRHRRGRAADDSGGGFHGRARRANDGHDLAGDGAAAGDAAGEEHYWGDGGCGGGCRAGAGAGG